MRPSPFGIRALALGILIALLPAFGLRQAWPMVPLLWGGFGLAFGIDALLSPRRRELSWELFTPDVLYIGRRDSMTLSVTLAGERWLPAEVALELSRDLEDQPNVEGALSAEAYEFEWPLVPRRRGAVDVEWATIKYRSPFGLWEWLVDAPLECEIEVLPDLPTVQATALRFFSDPTYRAGLKIERYRGDGTEFESLKEFAQGDDQRAIDWKASARHRNLMTRHFRAERNHQICLALDTGHLMSEPIGGVPKLDHALNAALLLAYIGLASGDRVGLFSFDSRIGPSLPPMGGVSSMAALKQLSSRIEYSNDETNFTLGLSTLSQQLQRRSLIILLTDFVDTVTAELMMENIGRIGQRHLIVFVSLRDPFLTEQLDLAPASVEDLNRAVVARDFLRGREVVHNRLRQAGVYPLDVEPARVGPELINRYLDIKRRERI